VIEYYLKAVPDLDNMMLVGGKNYGSQVRTTFILCSIRTQ